MKKLYIATAAVFLLASYATSVASPVSAASMSSFKADNIMSDVVMTNKSAMTQAQITSFLKSKNACNKKVSSEASNIVVDSATKAHWKSKPSTTYQIRGGEKGTSKGTFNCIERTSYGGESAARIIYRASQDYNINPQVLLVLLEKEQGLITDLWPNSVQLASATGYDCPDDDKGCRAGDAGFKKQVRGAANMLNAIMTKRSTWLNYYPVGTNYIQYNENASCGGTNINIKNLATSALYNYTPYQPNRATLNQGWPLHTVSCGAYGNINFYMFFKTWFGSTQSYQVRGSIGQYYEDNNLYKSLGYPTSNEVRLSTGGVYQQFEKGRIYWKSGVGAWDLKGSIGDYYYNSLSAELSALGYPTSNEIKLSTGGVYQQFEKGRIYWKSGVGARSVYGAIGHRYVSLNTHESRLGFPTSNEIRLPSSGVYQQFEKGRIYWKSGVGAWDVGGSIGDRYYNKLKSVESALGYPAGPEENSEDNSVYQDFEGGRIYWKSGVGARSVYGAIGERHKSIIADNNIGLPKGNEIKLKTNGAYQQFEKGRIYWKSGVGAWDIRGSIYSHYSKFGRENGVFKYPSSEEITVNSTLKYQDFEGGRVYWNGNKGSVDVRGSIGSYYSKINAHSSRLGLPVGGEVRLTTGGVYQQFEKGRIYWKSGVGAWDVGGSINNLYQKLGADKSKLGYPMGAESGNVTTSITQKYQRGTITYKDGKTTYRLN